MTHLIVQVKEPLQRPSMLHLKESDFLKTLKKLIKWSILALVIELSGFFYVDRVYLAEIKTFHVKQVELKKVEVKKTVNVDIPENAKNISVSYDGKYASYILDGGVTVINRETGKLSYISLFSGTQATYTKWLTDRNRMYISQKGEGFVKISSYDAAKDENIQWSDEKGKDIRINTSNSKYDVKELTFSVFNNAFYANVGSSTRSIIYRSDAMKDIKQYKDLYTKVGQIGMTQLEDRFIYEDASKKQLYIEGFPNIFKDKIISNPCFLGCDSEDVVCLGGRTGDLVNKVYYGELKNPISSWASIPLQTSVSKEKIIVTKDGDIYLNDDLNGSILNLKTNKISNYEGQLVGVHKNGIASIDGSSLKENKINK